MLPVKPPSTRSLLLPPVVYQMKDKMHSTDAQLSFKHEIMKIMKTMMNTVPAVMLQHRASRRLRQGVGESEVPGSTNLIIIVVVCRDVKFKQRFCVAKFLF